MSEETKKPTTLAASGLPKLDQAGASIGSEYKVVRFRKQARPMTRAFIAQIDAMHDRLADHHYPAEDLHRLLCRVLALAETLSPLAEADVAHLLPPAGYDGGGLLGGLAAFREGGDS